MQQQTSEFIRKFSDGLKYARLARGLTQVELAEKLGEKQSVVGNWETGQNGPGRKLAKVAEFFDVYIDPTTGEWGGRPHARYRMTVLTSESGFKERPLAGVDDVAWMLQDFPEEALVEKLNRSLRDADVPLVERVRRARMFLDELDRRARVVAPAEGLEASSVVDAVAKEALDKGVAQVVRSRPPVKYAPTPKAASTTDKSGGPGGGAGQGSAGQP